jgi:hypothetical protein
LTGGHEIYNSSSSRSPSMVMTVVLRLFIVTCYVVHLVAQVLCLCA